MNHEDILDLVHESLFARDPEGRILTWNKASEALYGFTRGQAVGQLACELLLQKDLTAQHEALFASGHWEGELERRTAAGDIRLIEVRWALRRDAAGEPVEIIEVGRDITARRLAEQALRDSEYRYRNMFQAMAASFWELDFSGVGAMLRELRAKGIKDYPAYFEAHPEFVRAMMKATRVIDVNEQTVTLFGAGDKKTLLTTVEPFWPESSNGVFAKSVIAAVTGRANYATETKLRRAGGQEFDALFTACFPPDSVARGELLIGVIDISERKKAHAELQRLQSEFAHASRVSMLGELTASLAHEVNQPLAAIATNASAGLRWLNRPEPDMEEVRALTGNIVADARRAADIIARIRGMATHREPEQVSLSLNEVIGEAVQFLRHEIQAQGVNVSLQLASPLPPVSADRTQLHQVVVNLAMNAVQAMVQAGAIPREIQIATRLAAPQTIEVAVRDSGPGIPAESLERLFRSFFSTKSNGMGLGLPICRSIVETHGGQISAANNEGRGACFTFTLPALRAV